MTRPDAILRDAYPNIKLVSEPPSAICRSWGRTASCSISPSENPVWLANLRDGRARARINARIRRLSVGNPGDAKLVGGGVSEMRIDYGPGYRVYFVRRGEALVILVPGGDKRTQDHDITTAIKLARDL